MLDFNLEELKLQYYENKDVMSREYLYKLIDLLWSSEDKLYKILDENCRDNGPVEPHNIKEDMD